MAVMHLTQKIVDAERPDGRPRLIRDGKTPGLMLAVNRRGCSWKIQADLWRDRRKVKTVRYTLGSTDELKLDEARTKAQATLALVKRGVDPHNPHNPHDNAADDPVERWTIDRLWDEYEADLRRRRKAERTIKDFRAYHRRYLDQDWRRRRLNDVLKSHCRRLHEKITAENGPVAANHLLGALSGAWRLAERLDDHDGLRGNPTIGATLNVLRDAEEEEVKVVKPEHLPDWWLRVGDLQPLRRCMHRLGLLSGLRPGNLLGLRREWIDLDARVVNFPAMSMKGRRPFELPLSCVMVALIEEALTVGDILYPGAEWLFPTRSSATGEVIAAQVAREKRMLGQTGHVLRRTYKTMSMVARVPEFQSKILMAHKVKGISAVYTSPAAMRDDLLGWQERVSAHIVKVAEVDISKFR